MQSQHIAVKFPFTSKFNKFACLTALCTGQMDCLGTSQQHVPEQTNVMESLCYSTPGKAMNMVPEEPFTSNKLKKLKLYYLIMQSSVSNPRFDLTDFTIGS